MSEGEEHKKEPAAEGEKAAHPEKKAAHPEKKAAHPEGGKAMTAGIPEAVVKGSWKLIKGIAGYTKQLVKGVVGGAWQATAGAFVGGPLVDTGRQIEKIYKGVKTTVGEGLEKAKERRHIGKLGAVMASIMIATYGAVGNTLEWPVSVGAGFVSRQGEAASKGLDAVIGQYEQHHGGKKESAVKGNGKEKHEE